MSLALDVITDPDGKSREYWSGDLKVFQGLSDFPTLRYSDSDHGGEEGLVGDEGVFEPVEIRVGHGGVEDEFREGPVERHVFVPLVEGQIERRW